MSAFFLDGSIVIIFALFIFLGFKNGIAKSLITFIGAIFSLIFSIYVSSVASDFIYDNFIEKNLTSGINQMIAEKNLKSENVSQNLPNFVNNSLRIYNITGEKVFSVIKSSGADKQKAVSNLIAPAVKGVVRNLLSIILFWALVLFIGKICKNLSYVFKFPVIRQIDGILGGTFGAFKGYIVIVILMMFLKMFLPVLKTSPEIFSDKNIDSTVIFSHMYKSNLIYEVYKGVNMFIGVGV